MAWDCQRLLQRYPRRNSNFIIFFNTIIFADISKGGGNRFQKETMDLEE